MPKVSILLPNLNHRPFLTERFASIVAQSLEDWELIVVDGYSDDGSWEYIQEQAAGDSRIKIFQVERNGPYPAWNFALSQASGTYVYIATSDDGMEKDCLEKMAEALDRHPECGLAHCGLHIIEEEGHLVSGPDSWEEQPFAKYYLRDSMSREHVRSAPHDGLLHCAIGTIFTSITQLLIRHSVFQEAGPFRMDWGAQGDFEWGMRVSLLYNSVYVPEYLASWRRHKNQLTDDRKNATPATRLKMAAMVKAALQFASSAKSNLPNLSPLKNWTKVFRHQALLQERKSSSPLIRPFILLGQWLREPDLIALDFSMLTQWKGRHRLAHRAWLGREMKRLGIVPLFNLN